MVHLLIQKKLKREERKSLNLVRKISPEQFEDQRKHLTQIELNKLLNSKEYRAF